ncbi:unnamed protein product [Rodentolepis nana]|uniref:Uncharacterized protein n=1 Tax=Rodentolepis nana TaxID=102285 RepID=A0A3P7SFQ7_RODNA|nr:unnamed protein product [Rodentolepis nana]
MPPKNGEQKDLLYEIIYNFDNNKVLKTCQTRNNYHSIEIPKNAGLFKAAVGAKLEDSSSKQVPSAYSSFKYLNLRENEGGNDEEDISEAPPIPPITSSSTLQMDVFEFQPIDSEVRIDLSKDGQ